ncbi:unnamed protein product [Linum trigynum]|uniref:Uncharacterized protein n=1 Tax=Linum trigynum TaxID=586398 RepID=A0AAV2CRH9_9ROSI
MMEFLMRLRPEFEVVRSTLLNKEELSFDGILCSWSGKRFIPKHKLSLTFVLVKVKQFCLPPFRIRLLLRSASLYFSGIPSPHSRMLNVIFVTNATTFRSTVVAGIIVCTAKNPVI